MNGFTDLRPNVFHERQNAEESFWPSFTDLMMVVVMIFLVTTSALYIRNWQLVQEMSAMIESERMAREIAQNTLRAQGSKDALIDKANADLIAASEEKGKLKLSLAEATESLRVVQMMRNALKLKSSRQVADLLAANTAKEQLALQLDAQTKQAHTASIDLTASKEQLLALQLAQINSGQSLESLKIDYDATSNRLVQLRKDYSVLKSKYDKLLRPARSTKGKFIVTLRHGKANGALYYDFRLPGDDAYTRVSESNMHQRLVEALNDKGDDLYLKLVYPKTSGLSYEEAYGFRNSVLSKYDYYYRDQPLSEQLSGE